MKHLKIEQKSPEWWGYKVGRVSGTRAGQLISTRENSLIDEMINEVLDGFVKPNDFVTDEMLFGIENEEKALDLYSQKIGISFERGGVILSDKFEDIHMASPDGINVERGIVAEVKCTMDGKTQIKRFRKGVDTSYLPQIINYFACSDDVKEVHWISYCPFRPERELVYYIITRNTVVESKETKKNGLVEVTIQDKVDALHEALTTFREELKIELQKFTHYEF